MNKLMIALMVAGAFAVGCGGEKSGASGSGAAAGGDKIGVQECDDYIAKMEACFAKDPATKAAAEPGLNTARKAWKDAAAQGGPTKDALKTSCAAMMASVPCK